MRAFVCNESCTVFIDTEYSYEGKKAICDALKKKQTFPSTEPEGLVPTPMHVILTHGCVKFVVYDRLGCLLQV